MSSEEEKIKILEKRYFLCKAKVAAKYKPEYHAAMCDAYKDILWLYSVDIEKVCEDDIY